MMESIKPNDDKDRGQVGIGTLIVFIAMVLVAAIAAGVLINTAGFLQSQSEETGEDASSEVTNRISVVSEIGTVSGSQIDAIELNVKRSSGSEDIELSDVTITYLGPNGAVDLTEGATDATFSISGVQPSDDSSTILDSDEDVKKLNISLDGTPTELSALDAGDSVSLQISTSSGGDSTVTLKAPRSLSGDSAVQL